MSATEVRLAIDLCACDSWSPQCDEVAAPLLSQLQEGNYGEMSVLPVPLTLEEWRSEHRTARKRADRARVKGYAAGSSFTVGGPDWDAINQSATHRQGRPMSPGYRRNTERSKLPTYPCTRHATRVSVAIDPAGTILAYLVMIRAGELALVSQILGHADYLDDGIMFLLFEHALEREIDADPECLVVYNRHDSGTWGLRQWKEWQGFQAMPVQWLP